MLVGLGQGGDHHGWDDIRGDFTDRYRVIVFDHRGTGQSDKPEQPPYSTPGFAQDAIAILDHLGLPCAHIYGVSMGGRVCQWIAIDYPKRVGAVVLACTTPGNAHGVSRPPEVDAMMRNRDSKGLLATLVSPQWMASHPEFVEKWEARRKHPIPDYAQKLHYLASENHDTWKVLPEIEAPTLVIHGSEDQINMTANAYLLADRIPNAELHIVPGGRHAFIVEYQEEASRRVLDFLDRHPLKCSEVMPMIV